MTTLYVSTTPRVALQRFEVTSYDRKRSSQSSRLARSAHEKLLLPRYSYTTPQLLKCEQTKHISMCGSDLPVQTKVRNV